MEIFELRYLLAVAQNENVHRTSEGLNVSPGSLNKAISHLEDELGVSLFYKQGRNIRLTPVVCIIDWLWLKAIQPLI